jgi:hypothetical protein
MMHWVFWCDFVAPKHPNHQNREKNPPVNFSTGGFLALI